MNEIAKLTDAIEHEFQVHRYAYQNLRREHDALLTRYDDALKRLNDMQAELEYLRQEQARRIE